MQESQDRHGIEERVKDDGSYKALCPISQVAQRDSHWQERNRGRPKDCVEIVGKIGSSASNLTSIRVPDGEGRQTSWGLKRE